MEPIVSGTTTERVIRAGLVVILVGAFAVWYLRDGMTVYPQDNVRDLVRSLGLELDPLPAINPMITADAATHVADKLRPQDDLQAVSPWLGQPTFEHEDNAYYVGPGGHLRLRIVRERIAETAWTPGTYSETDLRWQIRIGYALSIVGLILLARFVHILTTRVVLTEAGLKLRGKPLIPWEAMTGLRTDAYAGRGYVELDFRTERRSGAVRLDSYVIKELPAILQRICERRGFNDPTVPLGHGRAGSPSSADPGAAED